MEYSGSAEGAAGKFERGRLGRASKIEDAAFEFDGAGEGLSTAQDRGGSTAESECSGAGIGGGIGLGEGSGVVVQGPIAKQVDISCGITADGVEDSS